MLKKSLVFLCSLILIFTMITPFPSAGSPIGRAIVPEITDAPIDLTGRVIILDPGHGIGSTNIFMGYDEQVAMLGLANRIIPLLEAQGATVLTTRPTEANVPLSVRAAMTNIWALEAVLASNIKDFLISLDLDFDVDELDFSEIDFSQIDFDELCELGDFDVVDLDLCLISLIDFEVFGLTESDLSELDFSQIDLADGALHAFISETSEIRRLISIMQSIIDDPRENATIFMNTPFDPSRAIHPDLQRIFEIQDHPVVAERFLFISLHSNATPRPINTRINGAKVFHISNSHHNTRNYFTGFSYGDLSRHFATILLDHISDTGFRNLGPVVGNFFVIREHNIPGVLAENGFHTNPADRARLMDARFMDRLAVAYLNAITEYFSEISLGSARK